MEERSGTPELPFDQQRPVSPALSDVSMKSDWSKDEPLKFRNEKQRPFEHPRPVSPAPSDVSMKSDWSKDEPLKFRTEKQSPLDQQRPVSPAPSDVSMKSDWSKDEPLKFRNEKQSPLDQQRPVSPAPSDVSMKSDWSKDEPLNFSNEKQSGQSKEELGRKEEEAAPNDVPVISHRSQDDPLNFTEEATSPFEEQRPYSPASSNVSMKSDWSKDEPLKFRNEKQSPLDQQRPVSPAPSNVSMKSDWSKDEPLNFRTEKQSPLDQQRPVSPAPSDVSMKSDWSKDEPLNFRTKKQSPFEHPRPVSPAPSDVSMKSDWSKDEPLKFRTEKQSPFEEQRPYSPSSSDVSMKSDWSKDEPLNFRNEKQSPLDQQRPVSPAPSDVSMKSDWSKDEPLNFRTKKQSPFEHPRPVSPTPSDVSMKSDWSKDEPLKFRTEKQSPLDQQRPVSPTPSDVSMKSDWSKDEPVNFSNEKPSGQSKEELGRKEEEAAPNDVPVISHRSQDDPLNFTEEATSPLDQQRPVSPAPSDVSMKSDWSKDEPLKFRNEKQSPLDQQRPVSPAPSDVSMKSDWSKDEPVKFRNEKQSGQSKEELGRKEEEAAPNDVPVISHRSQDDPLNLAEEATSWAGEQRVSPVPSSSARRSKDVLDFTSDSETDTEKSPMQKLTSSLKDRILLMYDADLRQKATNSVLCLAQSEKDQQLVQIRNEELFKLSKEKPTVLTKGEAGVGKTFQTRMFMVDWARGKSNTDIDLLIPLHFSDLNSRKNKVQSMEELLHGILQESKQLGVSSYDDCNIAFVLDGLEKCELPLKFKKNKKLTDTREKASMDVLLTSLIEGTLLPTARLWIISQQSGVKKIPKENIHTVTECRDKDARAKLIKLQKKRILNDYEGDVRKHEVNSELLIIQASENNKEDRESKLTKHDELFRSTNRKQLRTVLTKGVEGIGKTFQTRMFMVDWARGNSNKDIDLLIPLQFRDLNSRRGGVQTMEKLLHSFVKDAKILGFSSFDDFNVAFVLDGLEKCKLPLDFETKEDFTGMRDSASMDVLLTSLIKGTLLPTARLWIISQHSGVDKIPKKYIHTVTECREKDARAELIQLQKKRILDDHEGDVRKHEVNSELLIIQASENNKEYRESKLTKHDELFRSTNLKELRTVLTKGVERIGKTFQTRMFMVDWARGNSNKDIDLLIPLHFRDLNSRRGGVQTMEKLLHSFLKEAKKLGFSSFDGFNVAFVLDGLEKCELPLDFETKEDLTGMRDSASMDVLLTSLIKGTLLPTARLWIISQHSGVDKIPKKYIHTVTECRDKDARAKLIQLQKKRILDDYEGDVRKDKVNSELLIIQASENNREDRESKLTKHDELFRSTNRKQLRTVLTKGVERIGKTFQTRMFMVDWARGNSNKDIDLLIPLHFRDLNSRRGGVQTMEKLLHSFLKEAKKLGFSSFDGFNVAFVLDGLEEFELPLDFETKEDLTGMRDSASIDVLLTSLIKGTLLPTARLWIISQHSGVDKIPKKYIHTVTECRDKDARAKLIKLQKKRILDDYEGDVRKHEVNSELLIIQASENNQGDRESKLTKHDELFRSTNRKQLRTVLTKGVEGIGKTSQTRMFMVDWARGNSNKNIHLLIPLHFRDLNSRRDEVQSMEKLLHSFLEEAKKCGFSSFDGFNVAFILDGLEEFELPLDFETKEDLTGMREEASMDVLLTSLIKGTLLPTARLWIISQHSGVDKIPKKYIHTVTECREKDARAKLIKLQKKRILDAYGEDVLEHEVNSELFIIQASENNKEERESKLTKHDELFRSTNNKQLRTVLTKGVERIGKTFQTRMFMVDWARGKSNKDIDLLIPLHFRDLNRKGGVQTMEKLLHSFLKEAKKFGFSSFDGFNVVFVLDGLEECELPLDFETKEDLTGMTDSASMAVLLTSLIKGTLHRTARLWMISQHAGVAKIPHEYIQKVTECRESVKRREKLASDLKQRFLREITQAEDVTHPNQKNTEHIIRGDRRAEAGGKQEIGQFEETPATKVTTTSEIFKHGKEQTIRTILTIGEADIGKTFHAQKFTRDWAGGSTRLVTRLWNKAIAKMGWSEDDVEVLIPLTFSRLNVLKREKVSLVGLLNHFFEETKKNVISNYAVLKILFVFDGLDKFDLPLDFDNGDLTDVREQASVDVLLTNLIKGNLLPSARLWITSRPSAAKKLRELVDRVTEIREKPDVASHRKIKNQLREEFNRVSEGIDKQKTSALLSEIYTDLYIVEGERGEVNQQHESRQVHDAKFKPMREETAIKYQDIFKPATGEDRNIRTVLTNGVAGIGKTFTSMKYMLDWAEGSANQDTYFMFPFPFRELNLRKDKEHSFEELIHQFFPVMKTSEISDYDRYKILIVLDGLDECRLDLDFNQKKIWDVKAPTSVNVLLTNLIQGNLLPKAQIWITSRPAASNRIPSKNVDRVTEVRGFNDEQKKEYFEKRFTEKDLAEKIFSHVKESRSLYIMCHIPVFCWITAKVLEDLVNINHEGQMPKTLTDMYIYFLLLQCKQATVKYGEGETESETQSGLDTKKKEMILSLGKLAFEELEKGNLFTEEHLTDCGIDIEATTIYSGLLTQILRDGNGIYQQKFFCFVHLSIQEFMAALYVTHTFNNKGENLLTDPASTATDLPASDLYETAVDKALGSKNGDWDLFLRFLLGLSLETNQALLQELGTKAENRAVTNKKTTEYIKEKIRGEFSNAEHNINLFHCLIELNDDALVKEVKKYLRSGSQEAGKFTDFSPSQWSALTFVLLTSDEDLDVFDLKKYLISEKVLLGMLPVVKVSKTTLLSWCELSEESCAGLSSSVLTSPSSNLTILDLSHNDLKDSGVKLLSDGLASLNCKLEILKLVGCQVSGTGCESLASALESKTSSTLKELDLRYNHPGESGKTRLSVIADDPNSSLQKLCLDHCGAHRLKPGLKKYGVYLTFDENTISRRLVLSEEKTKVHTEVNVEKKASYPEHEDRFKRTQVFCEQDLTGFCYWEMEWTGTVGIAVAYKGVGRQWDSSGGLGCNVNSWSLICSKDGFTVKHDRESINVPVSALCHRIAMLLDWDAGTLRYYNISSGELILIHTLHVRFTEPLFAGFWFKRGSVRLCHMDCMTLQ